MIQINRNPSRSDLTTFGLLLPVFGLVVSGSIWWRAGSLPGAVTVSVALTVLTLVFFAVPPVRRPIYLGWMYAAYPIGWTISHVVMAVIYYFVITPIGLAVRMLRGDPLERDFDRAADSYWHRKPADRDRASYLREF